MVVVVDIENRTLDIDSFRWELMPVYNDRLFKAIDAGKVILRDNSIILNERKELYYCARKIFYKYDCYNQKHYMDLVVYKDEKDTFARDYCNRSLGHINDINENEIHQVIQGRVVELIFWKGRRYWGVYSAGDYIEIPSNAYHCTYILERNTVVTNIYSNVRWEDNFELKPYFSVINDISLIKKKYGYYLKSRRFDINIDDEKSLEENGLIDWRKSSNKWYYATQYNLPESIFDLIN